QVLILPLGTEQSETDALALAAKNPNHDYAKNWKGVQGIDTLNKLGIPVYVAGGNGGSGDFNLFGLGNGAVNVGATQPIDTKTVTTNVVNLVSSGFGLGMNVLPMAANAAILNDSLTPKPWVDNDTSGTATNALIKRTAQGVLPVSEIKDKKDQVLGFNFTGGTRIDAPLSAVYDPLLHDRLYEKFGEAKGYRAPVDVAFRGTSFAAPNALGTDWTKFFTPPAKK
ncbi:MAG: hypothetical protein K2X66_18260, partial [Cyanobacteria bacterium]|nr:hypothetical protein [Cyanobacteriota bacterium]